MTNDSVSAETGGGMPDLWVCGDCRSINIANAKRCYKCGVLRKVGELTDATTAMRTSATHEARTVLATAARMGARYRPSWPIAVLLVPLILVVTSLEIAMTESLSGMIGPSGVVIDDPAAADRSITLFRWLCGTGAGALLAWSLWIAMVVRNVPALTARWPHHGPVGAFFSAWIPFLNLWRPYSIVRGVLAVLTGGRIAAQLIALAWWLMILAAGFGPSVAILIARSRFPTLPAAAMFTLWVQLAFIVPAGILAATLVVVIERAQRIALRRRAAVVFAPEPDLPL